MTGGIGQMGLEECRGIGGVKGDRSGGIGEMQGIGGVGLEKWDKRSTRG